MKSTNVLLGIVAGFAAGAVVGILFAPNDGKTTRRKIGEAKDDISDEIKNQMDQVFKKLTNQYEGLVGRGNELLQSGKEKAESVKDQLPTYS